jgi:hypothetical protein
MKYAVETTVFEDREEQKIREVRNGEKNKNIFINVFNSLEEAEKYLEEEKETLNRSRTLHTLLEE